MKSWRQWLAAFTKARSQVSVTDLPKQAMYYSVGKSQALTPVFTYII